MHNTAILLAAGKGTRMGGSLPKQYMDIGGRPLIAITLEALAVSDIITDIVMVIPEGDDSYIRDNILTAVSKKAADKVRCFAAGGKERYLSVLNGIRAISWPCGHVFIHDGARPFIDEASIQRLYDAVTDPDNKGTAVAAVPSKDTVKITDSEAFVKETPDRNTVWIIQTPQVFEKELITQAYEKMASGLDAIKEEGINITDDAMLVEYLMHRKVKLVEASYRNIKVTTPDDIAVALAFLGSR